MNISTEPYHLIGIGDFSHGDAEIWLLRLRLVKNIVRQTTSHITIYIEDLPEHANNIMTDDELVTGKEYSVVDNQFAYGPLDRYCYRAWDSPIFLKIIKYIRKHLDRIQIIGVDIPQIARDKMMADNIIGTLNTTHVNFFWATNTHVDNRSITEKYELKVGPTRNT